MRKKIELLVLTLFMGLNLTSCGEMIDGAAHVGYGITTFLIGLFKVIGVILLIIIIIAIIGGIIKAIFK